MTGALVYDKAGKARNAWFIHELTATAFQFGMTLEIKDANERIAPEKFGFAIMRAIAPETTAELERAGLRVFNNAATSRTANDKWNTYLFCRELGIPVMATYPFGGAEFFPCVVKSRDGHGGDRVFWVNNKLELDSVAASETKKNNLIIQRPASETGMDARLYVIGGKTIASVLRKSANGGFKSNFSLGGRAEPFVPEAYQTQIAERIAGKLESDYIAVDFIRDRGEWVLNEIEDCAGARMLYSLGVTNIAELFIAHVKNSL